MAETADSEKGKYMKTALLLLGIACGLFGQNSVNPFPAAQYCSTSGDFAAPGTFTIQMPSTAGKSAILMSALVTTSAAGTFTQASNGTNATTTAGTVTQSPTAFATLTAKAVSFTASNVGAGTAIGGKITTYAGGPGVGIDLTNGNNYNLVLKPITNSNYSIVVASGGTANVTVCWREQ